MNAPIELQQRLQTLEARQRRLRVWCLASTGLWIVSCLAAVAVPWHDELRVRRLVLVDESGKECGTLGTDKDGATLTLKSRDEKATVVVAASTAVWTEELPPSSFSIPEGAPSVPEPEPTHHEGPWSGLIAWTGDEGKPEVVTTVSAGDLDALSNTRGDRVIALSTTDTSSLRIEYGSKSQMFLNAGDGGCTLYMEGGDDPCAGLNLVASEGGSWIGGSWNDEHDFDLWATKDDSSLSLSQPQEDGDSDSPADVELHVKDDVGSLELRGHDHELFRVPK